MEENTLEMVTRLQCENYVREMVHADRIMAAIKSIPPSDGQMKTIRIVSAPNYGSA